MTITREGRHAEIALRYKPQQRERPSMAALRVADLRRLFVARYGHFLPDDDAGREDARIMAHCLARHPVDPRRRIAAWLELWAPWMISAEAGTLITTVMAKPLRWRADKLLAARLNLTEAERQRLGITTIGAIDLPKAERTKRRKHEARLRDQRRRRARGGKTRHEYEAKSLSRTKPWAALGISRRTWYRLGKPAVAQVRAQHT
jgi:hypothetical protein